MRFEKRNCFDGSRRKPRLMTVRSHGDLARVEGARERDHLVFRAITRRRSNNGGLDSFEKGQKPFQLGNDHAGRWCFLQLIPKFVAQLRTRSSRRSDRDDGHRNPIGRRRSDAALVISRSDAVPTGLDLSGTDGSRRAIVAGQIEPRTAGRYG